MNRVKLSICYPTYRDFDGVYSSAIDIPLTHAEVLDNIEILVVDNEPNTPIGETTKAWVEGYLASNCRARYVAFPGPGGPAGTKQKCVDEAAGEFVLVMDSHVRVAPGGIRKLIEYFDAHPDTIDLISGPIVWDSSAAEVGRGDPITGFASQMEEIWRGENLGIWASTPAAASADGEPFEVYAAACGLFATRKAAFVGFNPHFLGFGGEEVYLQEKTRRAGGRAICLPALRWIHRFGRPGGVPYRLDLHDKVRNYVLWHQELGKPIDLLFDHLVNHGQALREGGNYLTMEQWKWIIDDPIGHELPQVQPGCGTCGGHAPGLPEEMTLEQMYARAAATPGDINEHAAKFRELAAKCDVIVDLGHRSGVSTVAFVAAQPKSVYTYDMRPDSIWGELEKRKGATEFHAIPADTETVEIPECDLLFEDSAHTAKHVYMVLSRCAPKVRRFIVVHDTQIYGEQGEDGGPGVLVGLRGFMVENPKWSVLYHTQANNGLTVLGCNPDDKPPLPSLPKMAWNYAKALANHAVTGRHKSSPAAAETRMMACSMCEQRTTEERADAAGNLVVLNRCTVCGCYLDEGPDGKEGKLEWADTFCPLAKWGPEKTDDPVKAV